MKEERKRQLEITGKRIREARISKGMTQLDLALKCGYTDSATIYKIEKGLQDIPSNRLNDLCKALDVSFNDIKGDIIIEYADGKAVVVERTVNYSKKQMLINRITALLERADDIQLDIIYTFIKGYIKEANDGNTDLEREGRQMDPPSH